MKQRTDATNFFTLDEALRELDALKFAISSLVQHYPNGSYERELTRNAVKGIDHRLDYLHDSFSRIAPAPQPTKGADHE